MQRDKCCHTGGSIAFDAQGNLYVSTGDNTNPFATGYAPIDERPGRCAVGRAEVVREHERPARQDPSHPSGAGRHLHDPGGQPLPAGMPKTRPEIYTMGHRNPYRISVDTRTGFALLGRRRSRRAGGLGRARAGRARRDRAGAPSGELRLAVLRGGQQGVLRRRLRRPMHAGRSSIRRAR